MLGVASPAVLSTGVFTLPLKVGAAISACSVVVSAAPHVFPCGEGRALAFGH